MAKLTVTIEFKKDAYVFNFFAHLPLPPRIITPRARAVAFLIDNLEMDPAAADATISGITPELGADLHLDLPEERIEALTVPIFT